MSLNWHKLINGYGGIMAVSRIPNEEDVPRITRDDLKAKLDRNEDFTLLDVRAPGDYDRSDVKLPGAIRVTLDELPSRAGEFDRDKEAVAYCA